MGNQIIQEKILLKICEGDKSMFNETFKISNAVEIPKLVLGIWLLQSKSYEK